MPPKLKKPILAPTPVEEPIARPLPPTPNPRPSASAGVAAVIALLAAVGVGYWLGHHAHHHHHMPPLEEGAEENNGMVQMPQTTPTVSPTELSTASQPIATTVSAIVPHKPMPLKSKPVVLVQYTVGPAKPLTPRLPPKGDGHVLDSGQVLYCLATGELLDEVTPRAYTPNAHAELDYQTEDYNRRCGAYSYSALAMEKAMQQLETIRPQIHIRARQLLRKWGEDPRTPPMQPRYYEQYDNEW